MGAEYSRTNTNVAANIATGLVIDADDINTEFNALDLAFNAASGHSHDGTAAEGGPITVLGPAQEYVSNGAAFYPKSDDTYDLGTSSLKWKNLYVDGVGYLDSAEISGGNINGTIIGATSPAAITGTTITATSFVGPVTGSATTLATPRNFSLTGDVTAPAVSFNGSSNVTLTTTVVDDSHNHTLSTITDAGTMAAQNSTSVAITGGTIAGVNITGGNLNNTPIGAVTASSGRFTNLFYSGALNDGSTNLTATLAQLNTLDGITSTTTQLNYLNTATSNIQTQLNTLSSGKQPLDPTLTDFAAVVWTAGKVVVTDGTDSFTGYNLRDQDDMAADDAAGIPTQQSVKAYADSFGWTLVESITSFTSGQAETSTFESGFEYLIFVNNLKFTKSSSNQALGIEVYKGTSAAYHSSTLNVSNATTNTGPYFNGTIYLPNITRSLDRHFFNAHLSVSGVSTTGEAGINFGVTDNGCFSLSSAESITKVRIGNSGWTYDSGNFTVYKRRIS